ncbi:hypothetical protein EAG_12739 [Camponotus floridanus]|uniref:Uncharacterized protein n=1 Tax=Camponotus floridanus TaxID=104421 RepID=E2AZE1_CAMFO|nr:hypothetical protein EAG_12739 [Camponotus floridanus]
MVELVPGIFGPRRRGTTTKTPGQAMPCQAEPIRAEQCQVMPGFQEDPGTERGRRAHTEEESRSEPTGRGADRRLVGEAGSHDLSAFQCLPTNRQELVGAGFSGRFESQGLEEGFLKDLTHAPRTEPIPRELTETCLTYQFAHGHKQRAADPARTWRSFGAISSSGRRGGRTRYSHVGPDPPARIPCRPRRRCTGENVESETTFNFALANISWYHFAGRELRNPRSGTHVHVFEVRAPPFVLEGESATSEHSTSAAFPMQLWIICAPDRPSWHCTENADVCPAARGQTVTRGANLSCDSLVSFRPATRLPIFFSANDHEHPIACMRPFSPTPSSPSDRPPVCRAAMFELNDEPELVESPRPRVWVQ